MDLQSWIPAVYLVAAVTFVLGLKGLSGPTTAVAGNRIAAAGMLLAVAFTFAAREFQEYGAAGIGLTLGGMAIGAVAGVACGRLVKMTAMPQMVALFNGAGGGSAALVSILEYMHKSAHEWASVLSTVLGLIIGAVSFSGSAIAFGKLQGIISPRAYKYPGQRIVTIGVFAAIVVLAVALVLSAAGTVTLDGATILWILLGLGLLFGVVLVMPIGGADMPVVISLLNAYTGLAVAMAGFVLNNHLLIVAGTLVGASGTILTRLMSKAMNRSLANVLFAGVGASAGATVAQKGDDTRSVREVSAEDTAILLGVRYAIHPVAGRMPGHMNVLLAEANVPYDKLKDMEEINDDFKNSDVALVIGANDVTNPAARTDKASPIYGMPILNVDQAKNVIVIKRSMRSGFAGIDNELYLDTKTGMLFGDAKAAVEKVITELKKAA
ncbi:MAG: NAD(P)(+) transhydrogenase (Re/Si-specific) subunit beta [Chloroflexi bacterium]|nr:NAD(P)(+) transhydrogenase (Re/Si-specific) subunit beta [Chloroflexota bacterium]